MQAEIRPYLRVVGSGKSAVFISLRRYKEIVFRYAALVFLFMLTGCSFNDFFLGEDNRPEPKELQPLDHQAVDMRVLWQKKIGKGNANGDLSLLPAVVDDRVYVVSADGHLRVLRVSDGSEQLHVALKNKVTAGVFVDHGQILLGTANGDLKALSVEDGEPLWRAALSSNLLSRPVAGEGIVIARTQDGVIHAFKDNNLIWRYHIPMPLLTVRGNAEPVVGAGIVVITADNGRLLILRQDNGEVLLDQMIVLPKGRSDIERITDMDATPKINNNVLFASAYQNSVFALDLESGQRLWSQNISTPHDFALSPEKIFLSTDKDDVLALDQKNGQPLWLNEDLQGRRLSPPIAIPGLVGVVDFEGYLHWLDDRSGEIVARLRIGDSGSHVAASVLQDRILWYLDDGQLVAIAPE